MPRRFAMPRILPLLAVTAAFLLLPACDNVGRAFDPSVDPRTNNPTTGESVVQVVPAGGDAREGRPRIRTVAPEDGGWPATVPIVIEFSESVNESSILPTSTTGTDGRIILRVVGTTTPLPCLYDFLAGGRLLVMRPVTELSNEQSPFYEVVLLPDARDADGVRFDLEDEENGDVLTTFQVNQATSITDGRILATYPRDNQRDAARETSYFVVFDRPANDASISEANMFVRPAGGTVVTADPATAAEIVGQPDTRVYELAPGTPFLGDTSYELVVDDTITFGTDGELDFRGRTPYAVFDTVGPDAPTAVTIGNPTMGFPDRVNRLNLGGINLAVTTSADAREGDTIVARIYGFDPETATMGDVGFVENTGRVPAPGGVQTVTIDFTGELGTVSNPTFEDGGLDFAVQMRRGSEQSGFFLNEEGAARFDLTPPTLTSAGPPGAGNDIFTDLEHLSFHGVANEEIAEAMLTDGVNPAAELFGSAESGYFTVRPVNLGRLAGTRGYTLTFTDTAGNMVETAVTGTIVQRGTVTGAVQPSGTLTVEAFDEVTLAPIVGATVVVDPGVPTLPATGQLTMVTDGDGLAVFTGLAGATHTVTIAAADYDLVTLYETAAGRVSLPVRPAENTATFRGAVAFEVSPGITAAVGHNGYADPSILALQTTTTDPLTIPSTSIFAGRPQVVTALGGAIEPTMAPAFSLQGYAMLGPTLLTPVAAIEPADPGGTTTAAVVMLSSAGSTAEIAPAYTEDFALANGLDTANLVGAPVVRVMAGLTGFHGQVLAGLGYATVTTGSAYTVNATYAQAVLTGFGVFAPSFWVATEARDTGGRISRHRSLINTTNSVPVNPTNPPGIPVITVPGGPATTAPLVTYNDEIAPGLVPGGVAIADLTATDSAGRRWLVLKFDGDGAGGTDSVQFPDLVTAGVTGLQTGTWSVRAETRILLSITGATATDIVLTERQRAEAAYARSAAQDFTVQ